MIWLNPAALVAALALAAPIAIHVLVHRSAPRLAFPTLRFIPPARLLSIQRRALEDVALLAVRLALLAAAVAAAAGPFFYTAARRRIWDARLVRATVETREAMATAAPGSGLSGAAGSDGTFVVDAIPDGIARAVRWLDTQPPGRREILIRSTFPAGSLSAADMDLVPGTVGVRLERRGTLPSHRTLPAPSVLGTAEGGARVEVRREIVLDAARSSVRDLEVVPGGRFPIDIVVAEAERREVEAVVRSLLAERLPTVPPGRSARLILAGAGIARQGAAAFAGLRTPWMADAAARIWRGLTDRRAVGADIRFAAAPDRLVITAGVDASDAIVPALIRATLDGLAPDSDRSKDDILSMDDVQLAAWSREPGPAAAPGPDTIPRDDRRWFWAIALTLIGLEAWMRRAEAPRVV